MEVAVDYDILVIGAGTGGYVGAIHAAQNGAKVCIIEKEYPGGVCLNWGCIPTKTLLKSAEKWLDIQHCAEFGINAENVSLDFSAVMNRKNTILKQMREGVTQLLKGNQAELIMGEAKILDKNTVQVGERTITAKSIIVATGSRPGRPPIPGINLPNVIDSNDILQIEKVPASMLVIGAGVVGVEFASVFAAFGSAVTMVEMAANILPSIDTDLTKRLGVQLRKQGIKSLLNAKVLSIEEVADGLQVNMEVRGKTESVVVETVLVASGRIPNVADLGLENAGVEFDRYGIKVNEQMQTSVDNIYAVGDVTNKIMLAHVASTQGMVAVENIMGHSKQMSYNVVPACVFTMPEIATVGLNEQEAKAAGMEIVCSRFNFAGNGKALSMGETDGLVKIIAEAGTHKIIGMHILGPHAGDLIMEGAVAIQHGLTAEQLAGTIHPHPTLSEVAMEAAHGIFGNIVHQIKVNK